LDVHLHRRRLQPWSVSGTSRSRPSLDYGDFFPQRIPARPASRGAKAPALPGLPPSKPSSSAVERPPRVVLPHPARRSPCRRRAMQYSGCRSQRSSQRRSLRPTGRPSWRGWGPRWAGSLRTGPPTGRVPWKFPAPPIEPRSRLRPDAAASRGGCG
jgi:hypothetical protein